MPIIARISHCVRIYEVHMKNESFLEKLAVAISVMQFVSLGALYFSKNTSTIFALSRNWFTVS